MERASGQRPVLPNIAFWTYKKLAVFLLSPLLSPVYFLLLLLVLSCWPGAGQPIPKSSHQASKCSAAKARKRWLRNIQIGTERALGNGPSCLTLLSEPTKHLLSFCSCRCFLLPSCSCSLLRVKYFFTLLLLPAGSADSCSLCRVPSSLTRPPGRRLGSADICWYRRIWMKIGRVEPRLWWNGASEDLYAWPPRSTWSWQALEQGGPLNNRAARLARLSIDRFCESPGVGWAAHWIGCHQEGPQRDITGCHTMLCRLFRPKKYECHYTGSPTMV